MRSLFICAFIMVTGALAFAADQTLAGKWSGTVDVADPGSGSNISTAVQIEFNAPMDGAFTGKIHGNEEDVAIKNGKISGDQVTFEAESSETSGPVKFALKLDGDSLSGDMHGSVDSNAINGKVKLAREH